MKRLLALLVCIALLFSLAACTAPSSVPPAEEQTPAENNTQVANPMVEQSGAAAFEALGIQMDAPEGATDVQYFIIDNTLADIHFTRDGISYVYRASTVEKDISGVYDTFTPAFTFEMLRSLDSISVEVLACQGGGRLASWSADGTNYSLFARQDAEEAAMRACIKSVMERSFPGITEKAAADTPCSTFDETTPLTLDLDGDGSMETVTVTQIPEQDYMLEKRAVTVTPASGEPASIQVDLVMFLCGYACDADGDGSVELFVSGDMESCDYGTWLLRYVDGQLVPAASPYDSEDNGDWLPLSCSGIVQGIDHGVITVEATVDLLGTWSAETQYVIDSDSFALVRVPGSVWKRDASRLDPEYWDYCTMITTRELPVTFEGESAPSVLEPGVKLVVLETDYESYAGFMTEDGRKGRIAVTQDTENWGWKINGLHETEYFEMVPYAG